MPMKNFSGEISCYSNSCFSEAAGLTSSIEMMIASFQSLRLFFEMKVSDVVTNIKNLDRPQYLFLDSSLSLNNLRVFLK